MNMRRELKALSINHYNKMKTAAIIPAYNEEKNIVDVIMRTRDYVDEIIVVDDGSIDSTFMIAKQAGANIVLRHMVNMGKGLAMNTGMDAAYKIGADVVVFIDVVSELFVLGVCEG